ncbi:MAG: hypothetical protein F6K08_02390 [Okeania sp. SIO1H6]|nr:hypothetical protein [Okeania sp. SIO1H6]
MHNFVKSTAKMLCSVILLFTLGIYLLTLPAKAEPNPNFCGINAVPLMCPPSNLEPQESYEIEYYGRGELNLIIANVGDVDCKYSVEFQSDDGGSGSYDTIKPKDSLVDVFTRRPGNIKISNNSESRGVLYVGATNQ